MQHFSEEAWTDFVRGIDASEDANMVGSHLTAGCGDCAAEFDKWNRLREAASNEVTYSPPEELVRRLKLEFSARFSPQTCAISTAATPIFDSFLEPLTAGVRAGVTSARQLVFEADGLTVDLRIEREFRSDNICAVGQILDKRVPQTSLRKAIVILWTPLGHPVLETRPNEHGEFQLEFQAQDSLRLSIELSGRNPVRITLPELK